MKFFNDSMMIQQSHFFLKPVALAFFALLLLASCSNSNEPINSPDGELFPLGAGRWWVFDAVQTAPDGSRQGAVAQDSFAVVGQTRIQGVPAFRLQRFRDKQPQGQPVEYGSLNGNVYSFLTFDVNVPIVGGIARRWGIIAQPEASTWRIWDTTLIDFPLPQGIELPIPLPPNATIGIRVRYTGRRGEQQVQRVSLRRVLTREFTITQEVLFVVQGSVGPIPISFDLGAIRTATRYSFAPDVGLSKTEQLPPSVEGLITTLFPIPNLGGPTEQRHLLRYNLP